jgi:intracellular septation protein
MTEPVAKPNPSIRAFVDYAGPTAFLIGFLVTHNLMTATWALVAGSAAGLALGFAMERRIAPMPLLAGGAALVFGLLTLVFHDPRFIKIKPTAINLVLAVVLIGGYLAGKNPIKVLMGDAIKLSESGWRKLTLRYGIFFALVAALNEAVWRTQPDAIWVVFRMPGLPLLAVLFSFAQVPLMLKEMKALEAADAADPAAGPTEVVIRAAETQD